MGVYINGTKAGYSCTYKERIHQKHKTYVRIYSMTKMRVSRLGGNPVEMRSVQEALYNEKGMPVELVMKTKMSEQEIMMSAKINPESIIFKMAQKTVKKIPYKKRIYLEVPVEKLIEENKLKKGAVYFYPILDPISHSISECRYEILGKENILILGKHYELWHTRSKLSSLMPVITEEWIDDKGKLYKSKVQTGFLETTSLRMSRQKSMEEADRTFDIAFSTIIRTDIEIRNPQKIQSMKIELKGLSKEKFNTFPWNDRNQKVIEIKQNSYIIHTESIIFNEEKAVPIPVNQENLKTSLQSTLFCQSNDPEIRATAERIVEEEKNSWKASKKIADWIRQEIEPNYNVGFASAKETLKNREGDCSEHTVLFVALCRSIGIPARAAVGIMHGEGFFAYHMWPEVYVGQWVDLDPKWFSVDPISGEYFTDAAHIKFGQTELDEDLFKEMIMSASQIIGELNIHIIEYK